MPYKDPEKKKAHSRAWNKTQVGLGYGRWLYARRKLLFEDREMFKEVLEQISERLPRGSINEVTGEMAREVLARSQAAHDALGRFDYGKGKDMPASLTDLKRWLDRAQAEDALWLVIKCDTFDYQGNPTDDCCYPVQARTPQEVFKAMDNGDRTMEVYDMSMDIETQLREHRANHPPERPMPTPEPTS